MNIAEVALGVVTSMGGFVDIGELVFASAAGSSFLFSLLCVLVLGTGGIVLFSEMSGRLAIATKKAVFDVVEEETGKKLGILNLVFSTIVNLITCAAEIGGVAIILRLLTGLPYFVLIFASAFLVFLLIWFLPFKWLERVLGLLGLTMLSFVVIAFSINTPWREVASGLLPKLHFENLSLYLYYAVGILSSTMMPYEIYFYSSGAVEDKWSGKDLIVNKITSIIGLSLGSVLAAALIINSAVLFSGPGINPHLLGTTALQAVFPFGKVGLTFTLLGMLFAILGAAVETCLSGSYIICQFYKINWGREKRKEQVKTFSYIWMGILAFATFIVMSGFDPIKLVEYAVIFSVLVMPLSYYALFSAANNKEKMGKFVNKKLSKALGAVYMIIICIVAISAIPLMIITRAGNI